MTNITKSLYYDGPDGNGHTLPTGNLVKPGNLYVRDDEGALVFQMFTSSSNQPRDLNEPTNGPIGSISLNTMEASVSSSLSMNINAESYKAGAQTIEPAHFASGLKISLRRPKKKIDPLPENECTFKVTTQKGEIFYLYDVSSEGNQLELTHVETPFVDASPPQTGTIINGQLYVQFNDKVFNGLVVFAPQISIVDPDCSFRKCTDNDGD